MSFLLNRSTSGVPRDLTVWEFKGMDAFGQPSWEDPRYIEGIWEYRENVTISGSGKEESTDTVVFSEEELLIGSWVLEGRSTESKPPKEAREIRRKKTLNFIIDSQITYMYAL